MVTRTQLSMRGSSADGGPAPRQRRSPGPSFFEQVCRRASDAPRSPEIARRGSDIDRDSARSPEIARRGPRSRSSAYLQSRARAKCAVCRASGPPARQFGRAHCAWANAQRPWSCVVRLSCAGVRAAYVLTTVSQTQSSAASPTYSRSSKRCMPFERTNRCCRGSPSATPLLYTLHRMTVSIRQSPVLYVLLRSLLPLGRRRLCRPEVRAHLAGWRISGRTGSSILVHARLWGRHPSPRKVPQPYAAQTRRTTAAAPKANGASMPGELVGGAATTGGAGTGAAVGEGCGLGLPTAPSDPSPRASPCAVGPTSDVQREPSAIRRSYREMVPDHAPANMTAAAPVGECDASRKRMVSESMSPR